MSEADEDSDSTTTTLNFDAKLHGEGKTLNFTYVSSSEGRGNYYYVQSDKDTINSLYKHIREQDPGTYKTYRFAMEKYLHWNNDTYLDVWDALKHDEVRDRLAIYIRNEEDKQTVVYDLKELIERARGAPAVPSGGGKRRRRTKRRRTKRRKSNKTRKRKSRRTKKRRSRR